MSEKFNMVEAFKNAIDSMSPEELEEMKERLKGPDVPEGWVSIEDHLPMMCAGDLMKGYTTYPVKHSDGSVGYNGVSDHNIWYYEAKEQGITHWYNGEYKS